MNRRALLSLWIGLTALGVAFSASCKKSASDRAIFERCTEKTPCAEPLHCLRTVEGAKEGLCVKLCGKDGDCGKGLRCTGRYKRHAEAIDVFCRKPAVELGGDCSKLAQGCMPGTRCFRSRCVSVCAKDGDCPNRAHRCVPVVVDSLLVKLRSELYRVCLPAPQESGQACRETGPFCARGHHCYEQKCVQSCTGDASCGKGRICDGQLYMGAGAKKRAKAKAKPDHRFCRKAAKRNRPCHHNLHLSCVRGLSCVKFHCRKVRWVGVGRGCDPDRGIFCKKGGVCYAGQCRRACLSDEDCPQASRRRRRKRHKQLTCQAQTVRKQKVKICL